MKDSIRLWDCLLSDPQKFNFTNFTCVALVSFVRDRIVDGDFACCMENLQKASDCVKSVPHLLNRANDVCNSFIKYEVNTYGCSNI